MSLPSMICCKLSKKTEKSKDKVPKSDETCTSSKIEGMQNQMKSGGDQNNLGKSKQA
jgi:hypothetical protein